MSGIVNDTAISDSKQIANTVQIDVAANYWKIILVDDDHHTHRMIKLFLKNIEFEGKSLKFISVFSGKEAKSAIQEHSDAALILLDIVMENVDSGLEVAEYIRAVAKNKLVQIVMLTGQFDHESEQSIFFKYDINDYKLKTHFTRQKLIVTVLASLRSFRDLTTIEAHRQELAEISASLAARTAQLEATNNQLEKEMSERKQVEFTLRETVSRYHSIFEESPISLWEEDFSQVKSYIEALQRSGVSDFRTYLAQHPEVVVKCASMVKILDINYATLELFEAKNKAEMLGSLDKIFTNESMIVFKEELTTLIKGKTWFKRESYNKTLPGKLLNVVVSLSVPPGYEDSWAKVFVSIEDITQAKQIEAFLRRYEFIVNTSQELMTLINKDHTYSAASKAFCYAHNRTRQEIINQKVAHIWGEEKYLNVIKPYIDTCFAGQKLQYEVLIEFAALGQRWMDVTYYPYRDHNDDVTHIVVVSRDVTEYKRAAEAFQQANAEKEQLLAAMPLILIGVSGSNDITHWNEPAEAAFDIAELNVVGLPLSECGIQWNWSEIERGLDYCRKKGHAVDLHDIRYTRSDGKEAFLKMTVTPFSGKPSNRASLLLAQDVTERKILESQLVQAQKLEAVGQLAAGIAHEINTPTQYIGDNVGFLLTSMEKLNEVFEIYQQLLAANKNNTVTPQLITKAENIIQQTRLSYLQKELPWAAQEAIDGVEHITKIVKAMKEFSHPGVEEKTSINVNRAIQSTITVARNEWKYVANVETSFAPNLPLLTCMAGEFNQVILNIIINAAHAIANVIDSNAQEKGKITVVTGCDGDWVEIRISDTGTGISDSVKQKIFDPFFTTKEVGAGTGQGLAIAYDVIVDKHKGTLTVESEIEKGATFIIRLPVNPKKNKLEMLHG